jgi:hypothetical protein
MNKRTGTETWHFFFSFHFFIRNGEAIPSKFFP